MFEDRKWVILTAEEAEDIDFSQVMQTSADYLCWNVAKSKTFVKYEGPKPRFLYGKDTLTHSQIRAEIEKHEWAGDPPEDDPE
tara:strand:- start:18 stop:266 length:249 start_codon:yes stop_codon:yes gene_type:complete